MTHDDGTMDRTEDLRWLSAWGLPPEILKVYESKGVKQLFPWQAAALACATAPAHRSTLPLRPGGTACDDNLIYTAPTSGGKSLVAEILLARALVSTCKVVVDGRRGNKKPRHVYKRAIVVVPYLSVVREKAADLKKVLASQKITVKGYTAEDTSAPLSLKGEHVAVCSIEKAHNCINRLLQDDRAHELCCIVVDELHLLGDPTRGLYLELMLTKLMLHCMQQPLKRDPPCRPLIVAMSATISGLERLATWLHARLFVTNYRPVQLAEHVVGKGGVVYAKVDMCVGRDVVEEEQGGGEQRGEDIRGMLAVVRQVVVQGEGVADVVVGLVAEALLKQQCALVFCRTKKRCADAAKLIKEYVEYMQGCTPHTPWLQQLMASRPVAKRQELVQLMQMQAEGNNTEGLLDAVLCGVAFHHSGLHPEERGLVERGFRQGTLRVVCCTTTLAAGVNLPAHRVIIDPRPKHIEKLPPFDRSTYLQMVGRAGRTGLASVGESYLVCTTNDQGVGFRGGGVGKRMGELDGDLRWLLHERLQPIRSHMFGQHGGEADATLDTTGCMDMLQWMVLDGVANGSIVLKKDIHKLATAMLLTTKAEGARAKRCLMEAFGNLRKANLVTVVQQQPPAPEGPSDPVTPTTKGRAVYDSGLSYMQGIALYDRMQQLAQCCCVSWISLVYVLLEGPKWELKGAGHHWPRRWALLSEEEREVGGTLQLCPTLGSHKEGPLLTQRRAMFLHAAAVARLLGGQEGKEVEAWVGGRCNHQGLECPYLGATLSDLLSSIQGISTLAGMASKLANTATWHTMAIAMAHLAAEAAACGRKDCLALLRVPDMTHAQARALVAAGIPTPEVLISSAQPDVVAALAALIRVTMVAGGGRGVDVAARQNKRKLAQVDGGVTGDRAGNVVVARMAATLQAAARQLLQDAAQEQADMMSTGTPASTATPCNHATPTNAIIAPPVDITAAAVQLRAACGRRWPTSPMQMLQVAWVQRSCYVAAFGAQEVMEAHTLVAVQGANAAWCLGIAMEEHTQQRLQFATTGDQNTPRRRACALVVLLPSTGCEQQWLWEPPMIMAPIAQENVMRVVGWVKNGNGEQGGVVHHDNMEMAMVVGDDDAANHGHGCVLADATNRHHHHPRPTSRTLWTLQSHRKQVQPMAPYTHIMSIRYLVHDAYILAQLAHEPTLVPHIHNNPTTCACLMMLARRWSHAQLAQELGCAGDEGMAVEAIHAVLGKYPGLRRLVQERGVGGATGQGLPEVVQQYTRKMFDASLVTLHQTLSEILTSTAPHIILATEHEVVVELCNTDYERVLQAVRLAFLKQGPSVVFGGEGPAACCSVVVQCGTTLDYFSACNWQVLRI